MNNSDKNNTEKLKISGVILPRPKTIIPCNSHNTYNVAQIFSAKHLNTHTHVISPCAKTSHRSSRSKKIISFIFLFFISVTLLFHSCLSYEQRMNEAFEITCYHLTQLKIQKLKDRYFYNMGYTEKYAKYLRYLYEIPGGNILFEEGWIKIQFVTNVPPEELKQAIQNKLSRIWSRTEIQYQDYTQHKQYKLHQFYIYLVSPRKDFSSNEEEKEYLKREHEFMYINFDTPRLGPKL